MRVRAAVLAAALSVPALAPASAAADPVVPPSAGVLYVTNAITGDVSSMAIGQGAPSRSSRRRTIPRRRAA